jgi:[acyl-carrier-protein] S-malonyltransferase
VLAVLAPGQGAQTPGMLGPWLDVATDAGSIRERLRWWSAVVGLDLLSAGTTWDEERIRDTAIAQPLLVAAGLASAAALFGDTYAADAAGVVAGHSVGELTAAALAGALSEEAALTLVRERGKAMAAASAVTPTGMTALLGGDTAEVFAYLDKYGLEAANVNAPGQIVAAGTVEQLDALAAEPPPGARLRPLSVAGAFHTRHMAPAVRTLATLSPAVPVNDPATRMLSNADGALVSSGADLLARLVAQVSAPVRWDLCIATLKDLGVTAVIELVPAGTLAGIIRREMRGIELVALKSPDDLEAARALVSAHGHPAGAPHLPGPAWRLVVAPVGGTFHAESAAPGTKLAAGAAIGKVATQRQATEVSAPYGGILVEWLAEDGDPVAPGQPLARLHPESVA